MKRSGFLLPFEQQFGEQQQLVVETDVADVAAARGDAGRNRGLVGDVVDRLRKLVDPNEVVPTR